MNEKKKNPPGKWDDESCGWVEFAGTYVTP